MLVRKIEQKLPVGKSGWSEENQLSALTGGGVGKGGSLQRTYADAKNKKGTRRDSLKKKLDEGTNSLEGRQKLSWGIVHLPRERETQRKCSDFESGKKGVKL